MNRYAKPMIVAASAIALAMPLILADAAFAQTDETKDRKFRQIAVEEEDGKKPAAEAAKPDTVEVKKEAAPAEAAAKTEAAPAAAAKEAVPEKKAVAITEDKAPAAAPAEAAKTGAKEETPASDSKTAAAPAEKAPDAAPAATPGDTPPPPVKLSEEEINLALQTELKRVGCYFGDLDGIWGPMSDDALHAFGYFGKIKDHDYDPSEVWLGHVKGKTKAVCPNDYGHGYGGPGYGYGGPHPGGYGGYGRY